MLERIDTIKVLRFGLEDAPEDANDLRLCEMCAHRFKWYERRDGQFHDGEYEGYRLYWLTDEAEDGFTQCEECDAYHGDPEEDD